MGFVDVRMPGCKRLEHMAAGMRDAGRRGARLLWCTGCWGAGAPGMQDVGTHGCWDAGCRGPRLLAWGGRGARAQSCRPPPNPPFSPRFVPPQPNPGPNPSPHPPPPPAPLHPTPPHPHPRCARGAAPLRRSAPLRPTAVHGGRSVGVVGAVPIAPTLGPSTAPAPAPQPPPPAGRPALSGGSGRMGVPARPPPPGLR